MAAAVNSTVQEMVICYILHRRNYSDTPMRVIREPGLKWKAGVGIGLGRDGAQPQRLQDVPLLACGLDQTPQAGKAFSFGPCAEDLRDLHLHLSHVQDPEEHARVDQAA